MRRIPLEDTEFSFDTIYGKVIGAGILPVAIDENGKVWFLLGKERFINHWRGSLKWSGFEGGRKSGEDVEVTAAREFIEESIGSISLQESDPSISSVLENIKKRGYVARIVLCILHGETQDERYHVTYLMQMPFDTSCPEEFETRRKKIVDLKDHGCLLEKYVAQLKTLCLPREGETFHSVGVDCITDVKKEAEDELCVTVYNSATKEHHTLKLENVSADASKVYTRWFALRRACSLKLDDAGVTEEDMLKIKRNELGDIISLSMNDDYIEKESVMWWEMEDLKEVISNGGFSRSEFFRAYFLPVLQRAIEEVESLQLSSPQCFNNRRE